MRARARQASADMWCAVRGAVGPTGRAVMAQSPSRLVITRSGGRILDLAFPSPPDPVFSMLLQTATDFQQCFGDGVKTYVIFLNTLIQQIQFKSFTSLVEKLSNFKAQLDSCFFLNKNCACVLTDDILQNVIDTFFCTRFTLVVSKVLAKLVFEWVRKLNTVADLRTYISNFTVLNVQSTPFSVSLSTVQSGFLLKGLYPRKLPTSDDQCFVKVYYLGSDVTADVETDISELLGEKDDKSCVLFVTNTVLGEKALFVLNCRNIYLIHGASADSVKFLRDVSISSVEDKFLVKYQQRNECVWLDVPRAHQLLLKAPSPAVCAEYADSVLGCLTMLYSCFKHCSCTVLADGRFEHALARKIFTLSNLFGNRIPPLKGRDQVLAWNNVCYEESDLMKHINLSKLQNIELEVIHLVCPALLSMTTNKSGGEDSLQSLHLRLEIISRAMSTLINLCKLDYVFIKPKKGRLV